MGFVTTVQSGLADAFDSAADLFDDVQSTYLVRIGARTVAHLDLQPGQHVLDLGCGSGNSAIPAALCLGNTGKVIGVDLSANLLARAEAKAKARGLTNLELRCENMETIAFPPASFDVVYAALSLFFAEDMPAMVRRCWALVKPGGKLAITVWGKGTLDPPATEIFVPSIKLERFDLLTKIIGWVARFDPVATEAGLRAVMAAGGVRDVEVTHCQEKQRLRDPSDWWQVQISLGTRWVMDQMDEATYERIKARNIAWIAEHNVTEVAINTIYAVATKPR
jgi:ubiquinone/menaquinone biosynthesis C-methylase UbiE